MLRSAKIRERTPLRGRWLTRLLIVAGCLTAGLAGLCAGLICLRWAAPYNGEIPVGGYRVFYARYPLTWGEMKYVEGVHLIRKGPFWGEMLDVGYCRRL